MRKKVTEPINDTRHKPAITPEQEENEMIALAIDATRQRIMNGTASSAELVHYLKLGTVKARLENDKLREENELLKAKTSAIQSTGDYEKKFQEVLDALKMYRGETDDEEYYDDSDIY